MGHAAPVRLGNRTYPDTSGSKPKSESVRLFFEFTINPKTDGDAVLP